MKNKTTPKENSATSPTLSPDQAWKLQTALDNLGVCLWDIFDNEFMLRSAYEADRLAKAHDDNNGLTLPF